LVCRADTLTFRKGRLIVSFNPIYHDTTPSMKTLSKLESCKIKGNRAICEPNLTTYLALRPYIKTGHLIVEGEAIEKFDKLRERVESSSKYKSTIKKEARREVKKLKQLDRIRSYPINIHPPKLEPYEHQVKAALISMALDSSALLMEQGTGKTLASLMAIQGRWKDGQIDRVLVVTLKSVMEVWEEAVEESGIPIEVRLLKGRVEDRPELLEEPWDPNLCKMAVVNYNVLVDLEKDLRKWKPDLIILDESQKIKNISAKRSKVCHRLGQVAKYKQILTGTPAPNSPLDYFSQYKFLDSSIFGKSYSRYKKRYARWGGFDNFRVKKWINQKELSKKVHSISYRITLDEAVDLPEEIIQPMYIELSKDTRRLYDKIDQEGIIRFLGGESSVAELKITALGKLQQICGGFLKRNDGTVVHVGNEKLNALEEFLSDYPKDEKVVIFAQFREEIKAIAKTVKELGRSVDLLWGDTKDRAKVRRDFQEKDDPNVLVVQLQTGGVGITLTRASLGIMYSFSHNFGDFDQARRRLRRIGLKHPIRLLLLMAKDTYDEDTYLSLKTKESLSKLILDRMVRKQEYLKGGETVAKKKKKSTMKAPQEGTLDYKERLERLRKELGSQDLEKPKQKGSGKMSKKKKKETKEIKEETISQSEDIITAKELADELGTTPQKLRAKLRESGIGKPSGRWEWPEDHQDLKKIRALFTGGTVEEDGDEEDEVAEVESEEEIDYSQLSKKELQKLCRDAGITVSKKASKEELIELLEDQDEDDEEDEDEEEVEDDEEDEDEEEVEEDEEDEDEEEVEEDEEEADNYEDLSLKELKELCKEADLEVPKKAKKDDLIELLRENDEEEDEEEDEEDEDEEFEDEEDEFDYEDLTLKELKELCRERELEIPKKAKKGDLIELLMEDDNEEE